MEKNASSDGSTEQHSAARLSFADIVIRRELEGWMALDKPQYFAQRRLDFVSATVWFHGMQTGFWSTNAGDPRNGRDENGAEKKYCTGIYIAGCRSVGQYLDSEVMITSINGPDNMERIADVRKKEMKHSFEKRVPIGVAVAKEACKEDANGLKTFPCPIPEGLDCVVLGWFLTTHMWPQPVRAQDGSVKTCWMVRMEKINISKASWWSNAAHKELPYPSPKERDFETKATKEVCKACEESSARIFKSHFVCLNRECGEWFTVDGKLLTDMELSNIVYNDDFLRERYDRFDDALKPEPLETFYPNLYPSFEQFLAKNYPDAQASPVTADNVAARNEALVNGFSCPQCGLANSRFLYHGWFCRNTDCRNSEGEIKPFSYHAPPPMVTPQLLEAERQQRKISAAKPLNTLPGYQGDKDLDSHIAHELDFGGGCRATIFRPKPSSSAMTTADKLFKKVQEDAGSGTLGLARRSVKAQGATALTNHFVENFGERYNLPFALGDIPFDKAPAVVIEAVQACNGYMKEYFGNDNEECDFNEMYIAAYLSRKMGMSYHDDGETGLGSIIGTWTLGGRATFKFCIKPQFDYGRSKKGTGWMKPGDGQVDPIPAGCTEEGFRKELRAKSECGEISEDEWRAQLQEHMDAYMADPRNKRTYAKRTLLSFAVEHGDIVIMWGANTQRYMEHAVDCTSPMRFALTFRRVTKDMGTADQWAKLDEKLKNDRAFTPPWAQAKKRKTKEEEEEDEGNDEGTPAGEAKKVKTE
ncbi:hypothetical protein N8I77_009614 [Diaporthe amygdali]|uniref:Alpha-ketoglutarate-dependent dioxygenase AlkB-like domain-containing protein n=1 Tax=Phomopsis amygdali TaxID=1214568 RepID=A0AAD9SBF0_PHOAM|nr:hypothetical protein N8I77_009614 [Diaporthe amygdali]